MNLDEDALVGSLLHLPTSDARTARSLFNRDDLDDPRNQIIVNLIDWCLATDVRPDPATVFGAARTTGLVPDRNLPDLGVRLIGLH